MNLIPEVFLAYLFIVFNLFFTFTWRTNLFKIDLKLIEKTSIEHDICLFDQFCKSKCSWIVYNWVDPLGQLELLMEALLDAEEAEDKV